MGAERTFLGEATIRLQRLLGVQGATSPEFDPEAKILPVVLVGDGTDPGYGTLKGRRWACRTSAGANSACIMRLAAGSDPLIVEGFLFSTDTADEYTIRVGVGLVGGTNANQQFLDRIQGAEPVPGLFQTAAATPGGLTSVGSFFSAANVPTWIPFSFCLGDNAAIVVSSTGILGIKSCMFLGKTL